MTMLKREWRNYLGCFLALFPARFGLVLSKPKKSLRKRLQIISQFPFRANNALIYGVVLLSLVGCGYQLGHGSLLSGYRSISIPYICGDKTGEMTDALVKEMSRSGVFAYCNHSADLCLKVSIVDFFEENIGYQQGPENDGYDSEDVSQWDRAVIPDETRLTVVVEVSVIESCSGCMKLGPGRIRASYDFDHDYYYSPNGINQTSLGQLTNMESAREAVIRPLSVVLARKVVDYVVNSW